MKRFPLYLLLASAFIFGACTKDIDEPQPQPGPDPVEDAVSSGITYQLLVYSFADSDGDRVGDFTGIENRLDYLKEMGVQALWLSPVHPAASYHGYDVLDYEGLNPDYGSEADFKSLLSTAHSKGIKVYLDFVLNHTSKDHPWFLAAKNDAGSKYRDYYMISSDPQADVKAGRFPMLSKSAYNSGEWFQMASGGASASMKVKFTLTCDSQDKPQTLRIDQTDAITNTGTPNSGKWLWWGDPGQNTQFYTTGSHTYTLAMEINSPWGVLVRTSSTQWDSYKYGAPAGKNTLEWGKELKLSNTDNQDILLPGMSQEFYYAMFGSYMPDVNYGAVSDCENSPAFIDMCKAADKWIQMGVDGFRLDAVKHIYPNANNGDNPEFLRKFHEHCNATWHAAGHTGDFYMVGEQFSEAGEVAPYYKGLTALFEFSFWWRLSEIINSSNAGSFVSNLQGYQKEYAKYRKDYIEATKLSNHDEDRAGSTLGQSKEKMKLAGAILLTCSGEPYIYQGEELGYWGTKAGGDEYVRTPILWNASTYADAKLGGKVDKAMLTNEMSVESQIKTDASVLNVYRTFGSARAKYKALAKGNLGYCASASGNSQIAAWYREYDGQKVLVVHNLGAGTITLTLSGDKLDNIICSNGSVTVKGSKLTVGGYASAVFLQ